MRAGVKKTLWIAAGLALAAGAAGAAWHGSRPAQFSNQITHKVVEMGMRVRPNLQRLEVVIPGRPHPPFVADFGAEQIPPAAPAPARIASRRQQQALITRRLSYRCSTNAFGHRGGPVQGKPAPGTTRIICFGDGVTFGHGVGDGQAYPAVLQQLLRKQGKYEVINAGTPGLMAHLGVRLLKSFILPIKPHLVLISLGTTDMVTATPPESPKSIFYHADYQRLGTLLKYHLSQMVKLLHKHNIRVAVILPPFTSFYPFPEHRLVTDQIRTLARELNVPVLDAGAALGKQERTDGLVLKVGGRLYRDQQLVRYVSGKPRTLLSLQIEPKRTQYIADAIYRYLDQNDVSQSTSIDGVHPTALGHRLMARIAAEAVQELLKPPASPSGGP